MSWQDQPRVPKGDPQGGQWTEAGRAAFEASGLYEARLRDELETLVSGLEGSFEKGDSPELYMAFAIQEHLEGDDELEIFYNDAGRLMSAVSFVEGSLSNDLIVTQLGSRGEGFGKRAMEAVFDAALQAGVGIRLLSTPSAVGFYERLGFTPTPGASTYEISYEKLKELYGD